MIHIENGSKYIGDFITVEIKNVDGVDKIEISGNYVEGNEYLILGEKKKLTGLDYLEFAEEELDAINLLKK